MGRAAWWATVHRVTTSQTGLKRLSMHLAIDIHLSNLQKLVVKSIKTYSFNHFKEYSTVLTVCPFLCNKSLKLCNLQE